MRLHSLTHCYRSKQSLSRTSSSWPHALTFACLPSGQTPVKQRCAMCAICCTTTTINDTSLSVWLLRVVHLTLRFSCLFKLHSFSKPLHWQLLPVVHEWVCCRVFARWSQAIPLNVAWMVWYVFLPVVCSVALQQPGYTHWCPLHSPRAWGGSHLIQLCSGSILQRDLLVALPDCYTVGEGGTGACSRADGEGGKGMVRVVHRAPNACLQWSDTYVRILCICVVGTYVHTYMQYISLHIMLYMHSALCMCYAVGPLMWMRCLQEQMSYWLVVPG